MVKKLTGALVVALALSTVSLFAASPHWVTGPTLSISNNTLTITGKAGGLGNTVDFAPFTLTGSVTVSSRCYTKSNNKPQADNKQETLPISETDDFPVRNGSVTVTFTVTPLSTLDCPGGQVLKIESTTYDLWLRSDPFPELNHHFVS